MKYILFFIAALCSVSCLAQYPTPEFTNEIYFYNGAGDTTLTRLEKAMSTQDTKTKMGGFGGAESAYLVDGARSTARFSTKNLQFVFTRETVVNPQQAMLDSIARANGVDPALMGGGAQDPTSFSLYKMETTATARKVLLMKVPGMFGGKKSKASEKLGFSVKKIKDGYWLLVVDKPLSPGEYAFTLPAGAPGSTPNPAAAGVMVFAFGVD